MSEGKTFRTGFVRISLAEHEDVFLSVTPGFELGPGIQRDGISDPRMHDPHTVQPCMRTIHKQPLVGLPQTTNPFVQRAGTWTLFHHAQEFLKKHGEKYRMIGMQSCGDLTMNLWHVALVHLDAGLVLCRVGIGTKDLEAVAKRRYHCLVKWKEGKRPRRYEFIELQFNEVAGRYTASISDMDFLDGEENRNRLAAAKIDSDDIGDHIEFALAGKPIIAKGQELELSCIVDRFDDVRHIFNLPRVEAQMVASGRPAGAVNFGEYTLYKDVNARRAALNCPIRVECQCGDKNVEVPWNVLKTELESPDKPSVFHVLEPWRSPTRRGEVRKYSDNEVEIFYPHNVYPFGVIGGSPGGLVCLASGGMSGRVGNTLEGIIRIMHDFFGCRDAMVLDEGFDTFHIVNPERRPKGKLVGYEYSDNDAMLRGIAAITKGLVERDQKDSGDVEDKDDSRYAAYAQLRGDGRVTERGMKSYPLNRSLLASLDDYCSRNKVSADDPEYPGNPRDVLPYRSQMRAVLIFARKIQGTDAQRQTSA